MFRPHKRGPNKCTHRRAQLATKERKKKRGKRLRRSSGIASRIRPQVARALALRPFRRRKRPEKKTAKREIPTAGGLPPQKKRKKKRSRTSRRSPFPFGRRPDRGARERACSWVVGGRPLYALAWTYLPVDGAGSWGGVGAARAATARARGVGERERAAMTLSCRRAAISARYGGAEQPA